MWTFDQPENCAAITSREVLKGAPVLLVVHYSDDHGWAFLDGAGFDAADAAVVAMSTVVKRDATLFSVADLQPGWVATRGGIGEPWHRYPDSDV